jgi:hypothetical protein
MGHLNLGNILFMFHHIHGTFKFREFGAAVSKISMVQSCTPPPLHSHFLREQVLSQQPFGTPNSQESQLGLPIVRC